MSAYLAIFSASLFWTTATQIFAHLGRRMSTYHLNLYKSTVSLTCFLVTAAIWGKFFIDSQVMTPLLISGLLGFAIADLFIFYAFSQMGPARTLMIAAFGPCIIGLQSFLLLGESLTLSKVVGLLLMALCLIFLSYEKKSTRYSFNMKVALLALFGVALDAMGVVLSKQALHRDPQLDAFTANTYRIGMALLVLFLYGIFKRINFFPKNLGRKDFYLVVLSSFLGTFCSLALYIYALSKENPAVIAGLGSLSPIYASIYEHIKDKALPRAPFLLALSCVLLGVALLTGFLAL